eukprot:RCo033761
MAAQGSHGPPAGDDRAVRDLGLPFPGISVLPVFHCTSATKVVMGCVFPCIVADMATLQGQGHYKNYDTHYVPVVPQSPGNRTETLYLPCPVDQSPVFDELVVFSYQQVLPRYIVYFTPR